MSARPNMAQDSHKPIRSLDEVAWMIKASCHGKPDHMFFPLPTAKVTAETRSICRACPVRDECLNFAMEYEEPHGVWGGLTAAERRKLRRRRENTATNDTSEYCGTHSGYRRHTRLGEIACEACREAHREQVAEHRDKHRERINRRRRELSRRANQTVAS